MTEEFYRLCFGGQIEWEHVEVHESGATMTTIHLSDSAKEALTLTPRATCWFLGEHKSYQIPGTGTRVCLMCGESL